MRSDKSSPPFQPKQVLRLVTDYLEPVLLRLTVGQPKKQQEKFLFTKNNRQIADYRYDIMISQNQNLEEETI